ncbi:MAG: hypothetical protein AB3N13_03465 [Arenibacterium sp.]
MAMASRQDFTGHKAVLSLTYFLRSNLRPVSAATLLLLFAACTVDAARSEKVAVALTQIERPTHSIEVSAADVQTGPFKRFNRYFALVTEESGQEKIYLFATENPKKGRRIRTELAALGPEFCKSAGKHDSDVSISDHVMIDTRRILTFIKCD